MKEEEDRKRREAEEIEMLRRELYQEEYEAKMRKEEQN